MIVDGHEIASAQGDPSPAWPLETEKRGVSQDFGKPRAEGKRIHVAEDLPAPPGTVVLAPESGIVRAVHRFTSRPEFRADTDVLLLATDTGIVIALGEIEPGSAARVGTRVEKGQSIAAVGGLGMLHFETYADIGQRRTESWYRGTPPPSHLRDPTDYLTRSSGWKSWLERLPKRVTVPVPEIDPLPMPAMPTWPPAPVAATGAGAAAMAMLFLALASSKRRAFT